ncbi:hypothetical protein JXA32_03045 [Candidatus Sumerlaeota bacterium]|nr:hypothetical protein [Candidatus Sumerlaeota bacterium]
MKLILIALIFHAAWWGFCLLRAPLRRAILNISNNARTSLLAIDGFHAFCNVLLILELDALHYDLRAAIVWIMLPNIVSQFIWSWRIASQEGKIFLALRPFRIGAAAKFFAASICSQPLLLIIIIWSGNYGLIYLVFFIGWIIGHYFSRKKPAYGRSIRADESPLTGEIHALYRQLQLDPPDVLYRIAECEPDELRIPTLKVMNRNEGRQSLKTVYPSCDAIRAVGPSVYTALTAARLVNIATFGLNNTLRRYVFTTHFEDNPERFSLAPVVVWSIISMIIIMMLAVSLSYALIVPIMAFLLLFIIPGFNFQVPPPTGWLTKQ